MLGVMGQTRIEHEGAVILLDGKPLFEIKDGMVYITLVSGESVMRRSASVSGFRREVEFCKRLLDDWDRDQQGKVVDFDH